MNIKTEKAPEFSLPDFSGNEIKLSSFLDQKNVVLIFLRGFM